MRSSNLFESFKHAFRGIFDVLKRERNMKIHFCIMILVIVCGIVFHISKIEWMICIILFGLVISLECVNTSIEKTVDIASPDIKEIARNAKDAAAGGVLVSAIISLIIGLMIFIPKFIEIL